jgi:nicotinate-nucleotide pyrophosphorylase (carboxylating)
MNTTSHLIDIALMEDIGSGDITTDHSIDPKIEGRGEIIAKETGVIAGLEIAEQVFKKLDPRASVTFDIAEGDRVLPPTRIMAVQGKLQGLLKGERVALNFLQRLSGIATQARDYVDELKGLPVRLVDTRKTTPGWRVLEKYAVRIGGAHNHRMGLYDGVLIKDNHIAACGGIEKAVLKIRQKISHLVKIEVEASDLVQVQESLDAKADVIMLDNMDITQIEKAVSLISHRAIVEVSGNVTKERLRALAATGVDMISVGALTHSARSVDLSMRIEGDPTKVP